MKQTPTFSHSPCSIHLLSQVLFFYIFLLSIPAGAADISLGWARGVGNSNSNHPNRIAVDSNGNSYVIGSFEGTIDFDPGPGVFELTSNGDFDVYLFKLDQNGVFVWAKKFGGTGADMGRDVTTDSSNNIYLTGSFEATADFNPGISIEMLTSAGDWDAFVVRLDASGDFSWAKQIGGSSDDIGKNVRIDSVGNIIFVGNYNGTVDLDPGLGTETRFSASGSDIFVVKLNPSGSFVWGGTMGGPRSITPRKIALDQNGNIFLTGSFNDTIDFDPAVFGIYLLTGNGDIDIFACKVNSDGSFGWAKSFGYTNDDGGEGVAVDLHGNVYITGYFRDTVDFDPGPETYNLTSVGEYDVFVIKLNTGGDFVWAGAMGGEGYDSGYDIAVDAGGMVFTTGEFNLSADFDPGPQSFSLESNGSWDSFISQIDSSGVFVQAVNLGGAESETGYGIAVDAIGSVYTTGNFRLTADFDPGPGSSTLTSNGSYDIYITKYFIHDFFWPMFLPATTLNE